MIVKCGNDASSIIIRGFSSFSGKLFMNKIMAIAPHPDDETLGCSYLFRHTLMVMKCIG